MGVSTIFFFLAAVAFGLAAFRVSGPLDWTNAGYLCLTIAVFLS